MRFRNRKEARREAAKERQALRDARSTKDQINRLLSMGIEDSKEMRRLQSLVQTKASKKSQDQEVIHAGQEEC